MINKSFTNEKQIYHRTRKENVVELVSLSLLWDFNLVYSYGSNAKMFNPQGEDGRAFNFPLFLKVEIKAWA